MVFSNTTQLASNQTDLQSTFTRDVMPGLYLLVFIVGLVLNTLAAWIFFREVEGSGLAVFLKNMVVADLLMLSTFPFRFASQLGLGGWRLHVAVCRYTSVLFYSSMYVGIVFLGLIGLNRYMKVVRSRLQAPGLTHQRGVALARGLSVLTWALLFLITFPNSLLSSLEADPTQAHQCMLLKTPLGLSWHQVSSIMCVAIFWAMLALLVFCYACIARRVSRSQRGVARRRSARSIVGVLLVFSVCFVPYHVCRVPYTISQVLGASFSPGARYVLYQFKEVTLLLSALNVCLDPVIYLLMCSTFRRALVSKLFCTGATASDEALNAAPSVSNL